MRAEFSKSCILIGPVESLGQQFVYKISFVVVVCKCAKHGLYEHKLTLSLIYFLKPLRSPLYKQQPLLERLPIKVSIFLHFSVIQSYFLVFCNIARFKSSYFLFLSDKQKFIFMMYRLHYAIF